MADVHGDPSVAPQMPAIGPGPPMTPYSGGPLDPVEAMGDPDPGGRDTVASTVTQAVANADARWREFQSDTYGTGSVYGDLVKFPPSPLDPGIGVGNTAPAAGFYDPPRGYGEEQGAPGFQGDAQ